MRFPVPEPETADINIFSIEIGKVKYYWKNQIINFKVKSEK